MSDAHPIEASSALPAGTRLGEFEILEVIGAGGFSIVYRARDLSLEREVAIKEYLPSSLAQRSPGQQVAVRSDSDAETFALALRSFVNEARLLASFDHPSLLKVYHFWEANGTAYMVMPVLRGTTLKELRESGSLCANEAWLRALLDPLLGAIETLHAQGVYHRDIAPDNIMMIEADGRPVLLDFGAARRVIGDHAQVLTAILKPAYAPIEQYAESGAVKQGPWTDLYALGATLHFMLLGRAPASSTVRVVHDGHEALASQTLPGVSTEFLTIIDWMLGLWPANRPQSVAGLRAALAGLPVPTDSNPATVAGPPPEHELPPARAARPGLLTLAWRAIVGRRAPEPPVPSLPASPFDSRERTVIMAQPIPAATAAWPKAALDPAGTGDSTVLLGGASPAVAGPLRSPEFGVARAIAGAPAVALTVTASDVAAYIGRKVVLDGDVLTIGRERAAYSLADPQWSRRHAEIRRTPDGIVISDLGSTNGTYVNGLRLTAGQLYPLHLGSLTRMGSTIFALTLAEDAGPLSLADTELSSAYDLIDCLQESPKGVLFRARNKRSGREVAIKILSPDYASFAGYRQRFAREAAIAARLQHPHICSLDDYGETDVVRAGQRWRVPFVAYEIMGSGNLAARLQDAREIPTETIANWFAHLAEALHHAHESGVVHGNLKPSAICFDQASNIYVTDFAIAGPEDASHAMMGTPAYMAPEQWEGAAPQPASDQYALAVLIYLLLSGVRPYEGQEVPERRAANLRQPPAALHRQALANQQRKLSPLASRVIERALSASPVDRHASIADFGRELVQALRSGASTGAGAQVFISYRRESSSGWVAFLADQLERDHGITSFVDTLGLDGAVKFPARIQRAIENCAVFVCLLGPETLKSPYVRQEIDLAFRNGKRMIPVMQEGFSASEAELADPATQELLIYDGVKLLDRQNVYIRAAVGELAQQIRVTLGDLSHTGRAPPSRH